MRLDKRQMPNKDLVIQGHPLFASAMQESKNDTFFPRIGVEWDSDEPTDDIGQNYIVQKVDDRIRKKIAGYVKRGHYEQVSHFSYDDILKSKDEYIETYKRHVVSRIVITGWALGHPGKKTSQFLYMGVDAVLPFVFAELAKNFGVTGMIDGNPTPNIINTQVAEVAHGFEIAVKIRQIKITYRLSDNPNPWLKVNRADVHLAGSKSEFNFNSILDRKI
jgi:hypothetical protein